MKKLKTSVSFFQTLGLHRGKFQPVPCPPISLWLSGSGRVLAISVDTRCMPIQQTNMGTNNIA
jgi:hypothetical protein